MPLQARHPNQQRLPSLVPETHQNTTWQYDPAVSAYSKQPTIQPIATIKRTTSTCGSHQSMNHGKCNFKLFSQRIALSDDRF